MTPEQLAEFLATDAGLAAARALQCAGVLGGGPAHQAPPSGTAGPQPILDWRPVASGDARVFERPAMVRCKPKAIHPKPPGTLRVCLFGESTAAGFPLAPAYTPAIALEERLRAALGGDRALEVIDLAMPNMGPTEQLRVCEAARQIAPDVFVFLTGNNWHYGLSVEPTSGPTTRVEYARHLAEGGPPRLAQVFRAALIARARVMIRVFAAAARAAGGQALLVIPAANHAWERRNAAPWLGQGRTAAWFEHLRVAEAALAQGDHGAALATATAMQAIDETLSGTPQRLAARAHLAAGRPREARDAAMQAIDAAHWHNFSWALPQVPSYLAEVMRDTAAELGVASLDLDALFAEHTGSPFLDFRMFFDHCHLTTEGIAVAMSAVAAMVAAPVLQRDVPWRALVDAGAAPAGLVAGSAAFQAAHWLSHFSPTPDALALAAQLRSQLRAALATDEHLATVLTDQLRFKGIACAPALHGGFPAATRIPGVGAALASRRLNAPLFAAIVDVLRAHGAAGDLETVLDAVIATWHAALRDGLDLSHPWRCEWFWERTPRAWHDPGERQGTPFYRAAWPESRFVFLATPEHALDLELVSRSSSAGPIGVDINGSPLGAFNATARWGRWRATVAPERLARGVNRVSVRWPAIAADDDTALATAVHRLERGVDADLFPVFGEVYTLTARTRPESTRG